MNDSLEAFPSPQKHSPEELKRKRLWRNLFALNLCLSLLLIALFWIPIKVAELDDTLNKTSIDLPKKGEVKQTETAQADPVSIPNMLETKTMIINAASEKNWAYFDFSRNQQIDIFDQSSLEWDLAFRRAKVLTNSGASNKIGNAGLIDLGEKDFDSVAEVPLDNYVQDTPTRTEPENAALLKWYKYNYLSHKLTPKKNVYAIRTADKKFAKVQFLNFYCENKELGCIEMRYVYQDNGSNSFLKEPGLSDHNG
ncbi:MAG: hypothetical protein A3K09_02905 [Nitrospinae bacterium RIFCSPLOWO2_12_FULL_47_7]|nr:MAG: hypothetical protein A3K09_02905 [Nitrospinae bacterium RIFCSPLOWO2_12_FULL_47_7]